MDSWPDRFFAQEGAVPSDVTRGLPLAEPALPLVLVAEPEEESRHIIMTALEEVGYAVRQVTDGTEALRLLTEATQPVVLVAEEVLPDFGGFQLAELMSLANTNHATMERFSAVVLTENLVEALGQSGRHGRDPEPLEVLVKPFHINELLLAVGLAADRLVTGYTDAAHEAQAM